MTRSFPAVLLGLAAPTAAFVVSIPGLSSPPRDYVRTTSSSTRMSDSNTFRPELERLFAQPSFSKTLQPDVDVTEVTKELKKHLGKIPEKDPEKVPGRDPRGPLPPWATAEKIANLTAESTSAPKPATASRTPGILSIQTIPEMDAVVAARPIVVVKYYAPWCRSCLFMKPSFEKLAKGALSSAKAEFVEVEYDASRVLIYLAEIKALPCTQIYRDGALVGTYKVSKPGQFANFEESFQQHLKDASESLI